MSGQGRQAKILSETQIRAALAVVASGRYPIRDRVMVLLSVKAGMRAKEIACLSWSMVTDAEGAIGEAIHLTNGASKGKRGGRTIPLNAALREALVSLKTERGDKAAPQLESSIASAGTAIARQPSKCGSGDYIASSASRARARTQAGVRSSPKPHGRSSNAAAACATCRNSPDTPASPPRSVTSREMPRRSVGW